jgi:peptidoglycan/LPS O-acetylase OafA/YrhL
MPQASQGTSALGRAAFGAIGGALVGVAFLAIAAIRLVVALLTGTSISGEGYHLTQLLTFVVIYCGSFAVAGAALAALWPLRQSRLGAYSLGYLGAAIVSVILGLMIMWMEHDRDWGMFVTTAAIMTLIFGTVAGYQIRRWDRT